MDFDNLIIPEAGYYYKLGVLNFLLEVSYLLNPHKYKIWGACSWLN